MLSSEVSFNNIRLLVAVRTNTSYCIGPFGKCPHRAEISSTDCFLHFYLQLITLSFACALPPDYVSGKFYCCTFFYNKQ